MVSLNTCQVECFENEKHLPMHKMNKMLTRIKLLPNVSDAHKSLSKLQSLQHNLEPVYYSIYPKTTDSDDVVNILWSGGFASTYRICQLLFIYKRKVRPVYMSQRGLDFRESTIHESTTVKELHKYIHKHYPKTKELLLPTEVYDSPVQRNLHTQKHIETLAYIFNKPEHMISPFHVALFHVQDNANRPHTELSTRPIEIILPNKTPHKFLRRAVEKWGQPLVFTKPATKSTQSIPDERPISKCMFVVNEPFVTGTLTEEQKRQKEFAMFFRNMRFILPCESAHFMHATAHYFDFKSILKLTWSCRHPQMTEKQKAARKRKIENKSILLYTVPSDICGRCVSCRQRFEDGFARVST